MIVSIPDLCPFSYFGKKMLQHSINDILFQVIFNLYQNIKSCITLNNSNSAFVGLRQVKDLSLVLFAISQNDLEAFWNQILTLESKYNIIMTKNTCSQN